LGNYFTETVTKYMNKNLVSIIIPTKNSSGLLARCLQKVRLQLYKNIEVIIVDGKSRDMDKTKDIAKKYGCRFLTFVPDVKKGLFDATKKRNYAATKAKGEFIYHMDADMELSRNVVKEAIELCNNGFDAVVIPEDSFGEGPWARAKNLERRFFWNDDTVESPRFFKKSVWDKLGGYDENIAGGGDDRDLYQKLLETGHKVGRSKSFVMDNEGKLTLMHLLKKQFMYKREVLKYIRKRPLISIKGYFPIRESHIRKWRVFVSRPKDTFLFILMKSAESVAGVLGILYSILKR